MYLICEGLGEGTYHYAELRVPSHQSMFNVLVEKPEVQTSQIRQHSLLAKTSMCRAQGPI